jgi:dTDP-4-amino-4,6-dideoxygalactose transaminase
MSEFIPFNKPFMSGREFEYIRDAYESKWLAGDGKYTRLCHRWLEERLRVAKALLSHSGTAALEMAALLAEIEPGDEIIMPSYTFTSTANAFVLRGAVPVFVDVRADTLNIDERLIEPAITPRTKAVCVVHYAGVGCEMDPIANLCERRGLILVEDAAQGFMAKYRGRALGTFGHFGALSFHETKNVISGEGGALLVNAPEFSERAEIIREKGTNRSQFFRGDVDKYTWMDLGSSFLPGDMVAAFLWAQLNELDAIYERRQAVWRQYHTAFAPLEAAELCRRPVIPAHCQHNAHLYYLLLPSFAERERFLKAMRASNIATPFHYVPLHSSPAGRRFGRVGSSMEQTDVAGDCLVRLPLWVELGNHAPRVIETISRYFGLA